MVAADLGDAIGQAVPLLGALGLDQGYGQAVDEKDGIGAVGEGCAFLGPLLGHLEDVVLGMVEVDETHISLPLLLGDKDRLLAAQPGEGVFIALDAGPQQAQFAQDLPGPGSIDHAGIELLQLGR